jgi:hypothetical protein
MICPYCGEEVEKLICVARELHVYHVDYDPNFDELHFREDDCAELGFLAHGEFDEEEKYLCPKCKKVVAESEAEAYELLKYKSVVEAKN